MARIVQGLDTASAPDPALAKRMLDQIDGHWWNVYIGGPTSRASRWSPSLVREYARRGIDRFMLTYAGRQWGGPLTRAQGETDARDALRLAKSYGYSGNFPLCLDVERKTFDDSPSGTIEYARAWCATVRENGARPGVYANPDPLKAMHGKVGADFVWIANWVATSAGRRDPHEVPLMPAAMWGRAGERAWQYAGHPEDKVTVLGVAVDINVADLGCLAPAPGVKAASHRPRALREGDRGAVVVRLTHRLSVLRSRQTGQPFLDGPRKRFDAETETALKAFQAEHGLDTSGTYGRKTARALLKALGRAKEKRQVAHKGTVTGSNGKAAVGASRLPELVEEFKRLDAAADLAWQKLEAYGRNRRRLLAQAKARADRGIDLADIAAILARIEKQLGTLVEIETREAQMAEAPEVAQQPVAAHGGEVSGAASTGQAIPPESESQASPGSVAFGSNGAGSAPAEGRRSLAELTNDELDRRIDVLDRRLDASRTVRIARYARVDKALVEVAPKRAVKQGGVKQGGKRKYRRGPKGTRKPVDRDPVRPDGPGKTPLKATETVRELQRLLNRFTERFLEGIAPLEVDGKQGPDTNKRIRTAKFYLGYGGDERRSTETPPAFLRRLRHPNSAKASGPGMLVRAARRRAKQRKRARRFLTGAIEGSPKHVIDRVVLPICSDCGIPISSGQVEAANRTHGATVDGNLSDHQGPPERAWAADMSNGGNPTPQMDELARRLAKRFDIDWHGSGSVSAIHSGYRFQLLYRTWIGGNHFNHVHFGVKDV
jgi:peptidoglycan hydrolase-like protein with peptidoglycan-binding domain